MKISLDTNVLVSAFATRGLCADLFHLVIAEHELVLGETVLAELRRALGRKIGVPQKGIDEVEAYLRRQGSVALADAPAPSKKLEAADAMVVAEAVAGSADVPVSGDRALLGADGLPVKIVSPRGLWDLLRRAT